MTRGDTTQGARDEDAGYRIVKVVRGHDAWEVHAEGEGMVHQAGTHRRAAGRAAQWCRRRASVEAPIRLLLYSAKGTVRERRTYPFAVAQAIRVSQANGSPSVYHLRRRDKRWVLHAHDDPAVILEAPSKNPALVAAQTWCKARGSSTTPVQLCIHRTDDTVADTRTYPRRI